MKTENDTPFIKNGWLIAGKDVAYSNSPVINISKIKSICYYKVRENDSKYAQAENKGCYIQFDTEKWEYLDYDNMIKDYDYIINLVTGIDNNKNYI